MDPTKRGNRRLLRLASFLEKLEPKRFKYEHWVDQDTWEGKRDLSCGTTACALGWATAMPIFQRLGLSLTINSAGKPMVTLKHCPIMDDSIATSFSAAQGVFSLSFEESRFLFTPGYVVNTKDRLICAPSGRAQPRTVARHIRDFVKSRQTT